MKKLISFLFLICAISANLLFSQNEAESNKKIRIANIAVQYGMIITPSFNATQADFQQLAPKSTILQKDFSSFTSRNSAGTQTNAILSIMMGIEFGKNTQKAKPELRVGFQYFNVQNLSTSFYATEKKPCDTLISSQTGGMYFLDSVRTKKCSMAYSSEQLHLEISYIYRTNPAARFSGYIGIGASLGVSLNAQTRISYYEYASKETVNNSAYFSYNVNNNAFMETFSNQTNYNLLAYIPLGIDMRIIKKKPIWNQIHLFYEVRPVLNISSIPSYGVTKGVGFQQGLGIKVAI